MGLVQRPVFGMSAWPRPSPSTTATGLDPVAFLLIGTSGRTRVDVEVRRHLRADTNERALASFQGSPRCHGSPHSGAVAQRNPEHLLTAQRKSGSHRAQYPARTCR